MLIIILLKISGKDDVDFIEAISGMEQADSLRHKQKPLNCLSGSKKIRQGGFNTGGTKVMDALKIKDIQDTNLEELKRFLW